MSRLRFSLLLLVAALCGATAVFAQSPPPSTTSELLLLSKKIDEQNIKIDALSQQILKLQEEVTNGRSATAPGMVGIPNAEEGAVTPVAAASGNSHVVTRGETLTSISKLYKVGIDDLRKLNHIEDDRKLQAGQTLAIPGPPTPTSTLTPTPTPAAVPQE